MVWKKYPTCTNRHCALIGACDFIRCQRNPFIGFPRSSWDTFAAHGLHQGLPRSLVLDPKARRRSHPPMGRVSVLPVKLVCRLEQLREFPSSLHLVQQLGPVGALESPALQHGKISRFLSLER